MGNELWCWSTLIFIKYHVWILPSNSINSMENDNINTFLWICTEKIEFFRIHCILLLQEEKKMIITKNNFNFDSVYAWECIMSECVSVHINDDNLWMKRLWIYAYSVMIFNQWIWLLSRKYLAREQQIRAVYNQRAINDLLAVVCWIVVSSNFSWIA